MHLEYQNNHSCLYPKVKKGVVIVEDLGEREKNAIIELLYYGPLT